MYSIALRPRSFNSNARKLVNMLEAGYLSLREIVVKRITVIKFEVDDAYGYDTA